MTKRNDNQTPEFLKGANVDEKGLPLRMNINGERRLDQPYQPAKRFKLVWTLARGVVIVPTED